MSKMSDLHIELTPDTDPAARKMRVISKHLQAMADELELAKGLEPVKCDYCDRPIDASLDAWGREGHTYCSKGCVEMAGMEQQFPVRSGCGAHWPSGTWGQSCLEHCTCIDHVIDEVIKRLKASGDWATPKDVHVRMVPDRLSDADVEAIIDKTILRLRDCFGVNIGA